jgi:CheY-like chemotaxis protein
MVTLPGFEATEIIRRDIEPSKQPMIIALTADAFKENAAKCLSSGMNAVITKPLDKLELVKTLLKYKNM